MAKVKPKRGSSSNSGAIHAPRKALLEKEFLEQASILFAQKGYGGTSLADIADAVGLTRPAIYYYFKNKEAVLEAIVRDLTQLPLKEIKEWRLTAPDAPAERLRSFVQMRCRSILQRQLQMLMSVVTEAALPPDLLEKHKQAKRDILAEYRSIITQGVECGAFRQVDDRIAALAIIGIVNWSTNWFNSDKGQDADEISKQLADLAVHSVIQVQSPAQQQDAKVKALNGIRDNLAQLEQLITT